jgi:hypothetical protein
MRTMDFRYHLGIRKFYMLTKFRIEARNPQSGAPENIMYWKM